MQEVGHHRVQQRTREDPHLPEPSGALTNWSRRRPPRRHRAHRETSSRCAAHTRHRAPLGSGGSASRTCCPPARGSHPPTRRPPRCPRRRASGSAGSRDDEAGIRAKRAGDVRCQAHPRDLEPEQAAGEEVIRATVERVRCQDMATLLAGGEERRGERSHPRRLWSPTLSTEAARGASSTCRSSTRTTASCSTGSRLALSVTGRA